MNGRQSKKRSVHTYVKTRTVYFDWICISSLYSIAFSYESFIHFLFGGTVLSPPTYETKSLWTGFIRELVQIKSWHFSSLYGIHLS